MDYLETARKDFEFLLEDIDNKDNMNKHVVLMANICRALFMSLMPEGILVNTNDLGTIFKLISHKIITDWQTSLNLDLLYRYSIMAELDDDFILVSDEYFEDFLSTTKELYTIIYAYHMEEPNES